MKMLQYGDLVNGLSFTAALPVYVWMACHDDDPLYAEGPWRIIIAFAFVSVCCWYSYLRDSVWASYLAFVGMQFATVFIQLYQWPHRGQVTISNQFVWSLIIYSANNSNPFLSKVVMGIFCCLLVIFVAVASPLTTVTEHFPTFFGATAVYLLFNYYASCSVLASPTKMRAHIASLVLLGAFVYHMANELIGMVTRPGYATTGGSQIIKAAMFGITGLVAAGAFRQEIDAKEVLEKVVQERTAQIVEQAGRLRMVGLALEASETAIAITDPQRRILWLNPALQRLTGFKELQNTPLADALQLSAEDKKKLHGCFMESSEDEIPIKGQVFNVAVSSPSNDTNPDECHNFVVVLKDITEKRALERAEQAIKEEALLSKAMSESMEVLSHELRTPLQGIMGMTSLMLDRGSSLPTEAEEALSLVMVSSRLLLTLVNNILDVRKCDANMLNGFPLTSVPVASVLTDAVDFCRPLASVSSVRLDLQFHDTHEVNVMSDSLRMQQVLINLVSNAVKHSPPGGRVEISSTLWTLAEVNGCIAEALAAGPHQSDWEHTLHHETTEVLVVSVTDEGNGIEKDQAGKMFQKFSQLNNSDNKQSTGSYSIGQPSGTGLGLNLCLKFIQRMKGNIWVNNGGFAGRRGTSFSFYLPLASLDSDDESSEESSRTRVKSRKASKAFFSNWKNSVPSSVQAVSQLRLLVVDDTLINLKVLDRMMRRIGVGRVKLVDSGSKALRSLREEEFDVVISDIQMPEMSGTELSAAIRDSHDLAKKPIVVGLTAETSAGLDKRCADSGMVYALHKPITNDQLRDFFRGLFGNRDSALLSPDDHSVQATAHTSSS